MRHIVNVGFATVCFHWMAVLHRTCKIFKPVTMYIDLRKLKCARVHHDDIIHWNGIMWYAHLHTQRLSQSVNNNNNTHPHARRPECSVPILPSARMSEGAVVGDCDRLSLQQESFFRVYFFTAGDLDASSAQCKSASWGVTVIETEYSDSISQNGWVFFRLIRYVIDVCTATERHSKLH